jgi:hypothetical protein
VVKINNCYIILLNLINCINTDENTHDRQFRKNDSLEKKLFSGRVISRYVNDDKSK